MQVRTAALNTDNPEQYPIPFNPRIAKFKAKFSAQKKGISFWETPWKVFSYFSGLFDRELFTDYAEQLFVSIIVKLVADIVFMASF